MGKNQTNPHTAKGGHKSQEKETNQENCAVPAILGLGPMMVRKKR